MFEIKDLQQLIKIADCGTISRAAEELYISQPALSRSMQKLESELGVELFARAKNKVELNENGKFFVQTARRIVEECEGAMQRVRDFDRERNTFTIGSCAPAPLWKLGRELGTAIGDRRVSTSTNGVEELISCLRTGAYKMIIVNRPVEEEGIACREYCRERLWLTLPAEHRLASKKTVTFADIDGITMLLYGGIGVWHAVSERLAHTRFIVQNSFEDFDDLVRQSSFPSFTTDLTCIPSRMAGRVVVPIEDDGAEQVFYVCTKEEYKNLLPEGKGRE